LGGGTSWNVLNRLFILMTGDIMTPPKRIIGRKGRRCLYHGTPLYYNQLTKAWYCPQCEEDLDEERIQQNGYID
ncbi:MAG TPA: hypothetical protein PKI66_09030, partial [Methanobacteriaceae archaeon]|nr:hypothetical protein [Methanobacteriaceae archaeon]